MSTSAMEQLGQFYRFCGLGFFLGAYYLVFQVARIAFDFKRWMIFAADIVFFITSAFITFLFSLAVSDGRVRGYFLIGALLGFFAFRVTIGRLVLKVAERVINAVVIAWSFIIKIIFAPFKLLKKLIIILFNRAFKPLLLKLAQFFKMKWVNFALFVKKGLQLRRKVVYNQSDSRD